MTPLRRFWNWLKHLFRRDKYVDIYLVEITYEDGHTEWMRIR